MLQVAEVVEASDPERIEAVDIHFPSMLAQRS
jgi:hypothetical protein